MSLFLWYIPQIYNMVTDLALLAVTLLWATSNRLLSEEYTLGLFIKNIRSVVALKRNNVSVNKLLADLCCVPPIGWASHKFNLQKATKYLGGIWLRPKGVNDIMGKLKNLNFAENYKETSSLSKQRDITRRLGAFDIMCRYFQLKPH